ncbi:IS110 family transposase [Adlercreutzia sp. ZJ242]|uniref:IS110 family transposase n=1 Tax=Adlercreutzia sp. ZJ242 TaxID=2709409 RepID=UPI0013EBC008|nr:IS110 family transposase [Adlercreutzia sp. ZJ242]
MNNYTIYREHCSVFGMDVHARSVTVKGFEWSSGKVERKRFSDCPSAYDIAAWMRANFEGPYYAAYEAGGSGFSLCRDLRGIGIDCDVIATSSIARSAKDKKGKTDSRDASRLLAELLKPDDEGCTSVWVPPYEVEAARDIARAREDAKQIVADTKQRLRALLLRHGYVWNEKTASGNRVKSWGTRFNRWLDGIALEGEGAREALASYRESIRLNEELVAHLDSQIATLCAEPRWKPYVDALVLVKGIDTRTAFLTAAEFGRFSRFRNGRSVTSWIGCAPSESSSGEHRAHGRITKCGNSHLRRALTEGASTVRRFNKNMKQPAAGHEVSEELRVMARKATHRVHKRYASLVARGIHANKAKMAAVSEMARWLWAIGCVVERNEAAK